MKYNILHVFVDKKPTGNHIRVVTHEGHLVIGRLVRKNCKTTDNIRSISCYFARAREPYTADVKNGDVGEVTNCFGVAKPELWSWFTMALHMLDSVLQAVNNLPYHDSVVISSEPDGRYVLTYSTLDWCYVVTATVEIGRWPGFYDYDRYSYRYDRYSYRYDRYSYRYESSVLACAAEMGIPLPVPTTPDEPKVPQGEMVQLVMV